MWEGCKKQGLCIKMAAHRLACRLSHFGSAAPAWLVEWIRCGFGYGYAGVDVVAYFVLIATVHSATHTLHRELAVIA